MIQTMGRGASFETDGDIWPGIEPMTHKGETVAAIAFFIAAHPVGPQIKWYDLVFLKPRETERLMLILYFF